MSNDLLDKIRDVLIKQGYDAEYSDSLLTGYNLITVIDDIEFLFGKSQMYENCILLGTRYNDFESIFLFNLKTISGMINRLKINNENTRLFCGLTGVKYSNNVDYDYKPQLLKLLKLLAISTIGKEYKIIKLIKDKKPIKNIKKEIKILDINSLINLREEVSNVKSNM